MRRFLSTLEKGNKPTYINMKRMQVQLTSDHLSYEAIKLESTLASHIQQYLICVYEFM